MSTLYSISSDLPAISGAVAIDDIVPLYDTSLGRTVRCTLSQSRYKTVTASTNWTTTLSTSSFIAPNEGVVNIQATTSGALMVTAPTAAGQELMICSPNPKTTGPAQICVASSVGGQTVTFDGVNTILNIPNTVPWGVTLIALGTTKWGIAGMTVTASTVITQTPSLTTS